MRIECELCRQWVTVDRFGASADGIEIDCPACEGQFFVPAAGSAVPPRLEPASDAAMTCPKCEEAQPAASACRRCGLAADRFAAFSARDTTTAHPAVDEAWARCLARWGDPDAHEAFAERVVEAGAFAHAARLYRETLRERPGDPVAASQLDRMRRMAEAAAFAAAPTTREAPDKEPYRGALWLLVILALLTAGGGLYALITRDGAASPPEAEPMRHAPDTPTNRRSAPPGRP